MQQRARKLVGTIVLVVFLTIYVLIAMTVGATHFADASTLAKTLYYMIAGLVWVLPAGALTWWMQRPDKPRN